MASILKLFCFIFLYPDKLIGNPDKLIGNLDKLIGTPDKLIGNLDKLIGNLDKLIGNPDKLIGRGLIVAKVETSIPPFIWQRFHQVTDCFPGDMFTRRQISLKKWKRNYGFFSGSFFGFIFYCKFAGYKNINFGGTNNENQKS